MLTVKPCQAFLTHYEFNTLLVIPWWAFKVNVKYVNFDASYLSLLSNIIIAVNENITASPSDLS